jgi:hypothetical protein
LAQLADKIDWAWIEGEIAFMLMVCSSPAPNRCPDPVVACCFGRIATSDATKESWSCERKIKK